MKFAHSLTIASVSTNLEVTLRMYDEELSQMKQKVACRIAKLLEVLVKIVQNDDVALMMTSLKENRVSNN